MNVSFFSANVGKSIDNKDVATLVIDFFEDGVTYPEEKVEIAGWITLQESCGNWVYTIDSNFPLDKEGRDRIFRKAMTTILENAKELQG